MRRSTPDFIEFPAWRALIPGEVAYYIDPSSIVAIHDLEPEHLHYLPPRGVSFEVAVDPEYFFEQMAILENSK